MYIGTLQYTRHTYIAHFIVTYAYTYIYILYCTDGDTPFNRTPASRAVKEDYFYFIFFYTPHVCTDTTCTNSMFDYIGIRRNAMAAKTFCGRFICMRCGTVRKRCLPRTCFSSAVSVFCRGAL